MNTPAHIYHVSNKQRVAGKTQGRASAKKQNTIARLCSLEFLPGVGYICGCGEYGINLVHYIPRWDKLVCCKHFLCRAPKLNYAYAHRRFTRLTNAFSKKTENHCHAIALHFVYYNFAKIHKKLGVTPAMEAGLTKDVRA